MMIDWYVLLTPVLLLPIIALLRFLGCEPVPDLHFEEPAPMPKLNRVRQSSALVCGRFTIELDGDDFFNHTDPARQSVVLWDGVRLATHYTSRQQLAADVPDVEINALRPPQPDLPFPPKTVKVVVQTPPPGGGTSQALDFTFTVEPGSPNLVTFDDTRMGIRRGDKIDKIYDDGNSHRLDFGKNQWLLDQLPNLAWYIHFPPGINTAPFSFANGPRLLKSVLVHSTAQAQATLELTSDAGETMRFTLAPNTASAPQTMVTGWMKCSRTITITVTSSAQERFGIRDIVYFGPG